MTELRTQSQVESWLRAHLATRLGVEATEIELDRSFGSYGLASIEAINLVKDLETWLDCTLAPTLVWDYPTVQTLAQFLTAQTTPIIHEVSPERLPYTQSEREPIAIIGMSCRYPGASSPAALWDLVRRGDDAISITPTDRWDVDYFFHPDQAMPGKTYTRWGGHLDGLEYFDADFFGISPREAPHIDPRQRLMLETAWEALEDAGLPPDSLAGSRTGVFIATLNSDYDRLLFDDFGRVEAYSGAGTANSTIANRLSYFFDFHGPSLTLDTACSGSLVAMHLACHSLSNGESQLALVGGVSLNLLPNGNIFFAKAGVLSPEGRCKTFDRDADGIVRSDGAGMVVLKSLSLAQAAGDPIYAVIIGSAVNQDGRSNGIMAPNRQAQEAVLNEAYRQANVAPSAVQYIEAHGTGTRLGDPIEVAALGAVVGQDRPPERPCMLGSIKTNIGHTEAAAGIAGVIKTVLALQHQLIPPTLHFQDPNPLLPLEAFSFRVPQELAPWPAASGPRLAGVSSFGFGGTNAHLVLQEAPNTPPLEESALQPWVIPLSARTPAALTDVAQAYAAFLHDESSPSNLMHIGYTASLGRSHHNHRLALVARSKADAMDKLKAFLDGETRHGLATNSDSHQPSQDLIFVFSGQGSHWPRMGMRLLAQEPVFRSVVAQCDALLQQYVDWSLLAELSHSEETSRLNEADRTQPAIFAMQVALATLWQSWGVVPQAIVGHSLGEVAAAHIAGVLSLDEALRIVVHRSRLMKTVAGQGKTAVVGLPLEQAALTVVGREHLLAVAGSNSPTTSVLSGDPQALEQVLQALEQRGVFCRMVQGVDIAFHSPHMDALRDHLVSALAHLAPQPAAIPLFSTVTGTAIDGASLDANYWGRNLREPFLFADTMAELLEGGGDTFLEISPHPVLSSSMVQSMQHVGRDGTVLASLRRHEDEHETLLSSLGMLYTLGRPMNWSRLYPAGCQVVSLPTYPWQRVRYWYDQLTGNGTTSLTIQRKFGQHPLLGAHLESALRQGDHFWEMDLGAHTLPYLADHRILGKVLMPGAAYLEMGLSAVKQAFGVRGKLTDVVFAQALSLPEDTVRRIQFTLSPAPGEKTASFQIFSQAVSDDEATNSWIAHATGRVQYSHDPIVPTESLALQDIQARCTQQLAPTAFYQQIQANGLQYGPEFQAITQLWYRDGEVVSQIQVRPSVATMASYELHPVLLDASFQSVAAALMTTQNEPPTDTSYLPHSVDEVHVYRHLAHQGWCHVRLDLTTVGSDMLKADIDLFDETGQIAVHVRGLRLQRLAAQPQPINHKNWFYGVHWQPHTPTPTAPPQPGQWLIFADKGALASALVAQLEAHAQTCVLVYPDQRYRVAEDRQTYWLNPARPRHFQTLCRAMATSVDRPWRGVIYLWSLDAEELFEHGAVGEDSTPSMLCQPVLHLVHSLTHMWGQHTPRLWLITQRAQSLNGELAHPAQASLWGFGRVVALEHAELWGGLIDLDSGDMANQAVMVAEELSRSKNDTDQMAFRDGKRYVARLRSLDDAQTAVPSCGFRPDSSYLITGGLGGLGVLTARWMVQHGARRLILVGRTKLPSRTTWHTLKPHSPEAERVAAIWDLERMGASVHVAQVDVAHESQLASFLQRYEQEGFPPIRGVIHAAGLVQDQLLLRMDRKTLQTVVRPKMNGAWTLHQVTKDMALDFFVLFSSATALLGQFGQAHYAAGNAFMDALAHYRRSQGLPALSINWGPWAQVGMFARRDSGQMQSAVQPIEPEHGLQLLTHVFERNLAQVAVLNANWSDMPRSALLANLVAQQPVRIGEDNDDAVIETLLLELLAVDPTEHPTLFVAKLQPLVASVLRRESARLDPQQALINLGMDSIMAVELKNKIATTLGVELSLADLFTGSVMQLATQVATHFQNDTRIAELLTHIEQLSTDETHLLLTEG